MSPRLPLFTFLFLAASLARAAEVGAGSTVPDLGTSALQMIFGLLLVLGLLLGTLWLLKRISQPRGHVAGLLRVVAGVAVGSRERVVILELGNSWLVLGVAPGQVSTLAEIPRQEMPAAPAPRDFVGQLAERLRKNA
jgi:flagellar protein FliO/FliZ